MNHSLKGNGVFPRKVYAILLLSGMVAMGSALAQSTPTLPTAPTVPTLLTVSPNAVSALADTTTNSVFIDQSGANPTVNMTQIGSGNKMGSSATPVYLRGTSQNIVGIQSGNNNVISNLQIVNSDSGTGVGASVTIQQIGNGNTADIACGDTTGKCDKLDMNYRFTGNTNSMIFRGTGTSITSHVDVSGNGNAFNIAATGNGHSQIVDISGNNNIVNVTQTSTGASGSSVVIAQTGTGTTYNVQQSGSVDNVLNIRSAASGGSFNILQRN
jgi:hypothetical protein